MISEVKVLCQMDTLVRVSRVVLLQSLEYSDLNLARVSILLDGSNDLDGNLFPRLDVPCLDDFAKCSLS